jgi:hypothetical protein
VAAVPIASQFRIKKIKKPIGKYVSFPYFDHFFLLFFLLFGCEASGKTHATSGFNCLKIALAISQYPGTKNKTKKKHISALVIAETQMA